MAYEETVEYLRKQIKKGVSSEKIKEAMISSGYSDDIIERLLEQAGGEKIVKKANGIENLLSKNAIIGVFLLFFAGGLLYFGIFAESNKELLSGPKNAEFTLDLSKIDPMTIKKNSRLNTIDLRKYISPKNYKIEELEWSFKGKVCLNIQILDDAAIIRSIYLKDKCPNQETVEFSVKNQEGYTDSDTLNIIISD